MTRDEALDRKAINTIRFLSADAIEKARSGHPGMPMGAAGMAYVLWTEHLKHNPADPAWPDRDRFVLSAGHGSMLLYALLHLTGYDLGLAQIGAFRQWGSLTPGHPENVCTPGVEVTTGPLGQGLANAVGLAIAEAHLAARYNQPGGSVVDHRTYVIAGDGDLMEGVSGETCALAGHLRLGKLIVLYDDNRISLAGTTNLSFTEDVAQRFSAQGWQILRVEDGDDLEAIDEAITSAEADAVHPTLIAVHTVIGEGAPHKQDTFGVHGAPLGADELKAAKQAVGWPTDAPFYVPDDVRSRFAQAVERGRAAQTQWRSRVDDYAKQYPALASELSRRLAGDLPAGWDRDLPVFPPDEKGVPTRKASAAILERLAAHVPELIGGSADLNPSTYTAIPEEGDLQPDGPRPVPVQGAVGGVWGYAGRNLHFGVREHAMGAIAVGLASHGGVLPYTATFLTFSDYMRPPMRLAALSERRVIFIFTHDSIGLGEDGPTHQPIEQLMNLRAVPNLAVIRPTDANEVREAWRVALNRGGGPTALVFSRQNLPVLDRERYGDAGKLARGGYVLWQTGEGCPDVILIGTGSEVQLALAAAAALGEEGTNARVVALPSWELFDAQPLAYRDEVLPPDVRARVAVEAGMRLGWEHYVGLDGEIIGMDRFGASAPASVLYERFGITTDAVVAAAKRVLKRLTA